MERMTAEAYRASIQGKRNRAMGLKFEDIVNEACEHYKSLDIAYIEKTPEPMRVIGIINRKLGHFKAIFQKQAQPDYKGTMNGGQSVVFEAKSTSAERIEQNAVTEEQWEALDKHEAMGAWAFVLVQLGNRFYRVRWSDWKNMKQLFGHKYMNAADLEPYEVEYRSGVICFIGLNAGTKRAIESAER